MIHVLRASDFEFFLSILTKFNFDLFPVEKYSEMKFFWWFLSESGQSPKIPMLQKTNLKTLLNINQFSQVVLDLLEWLTDFRIFILILANGCPISYRTKVNFDLSSNHVFKTIVIFKHLLNTNNNWIKKFKHEIK